jgi:Ca2+-transporting ATPase
MTATQVRAVDREYLVTGTGYDPAGHIEIDGNRVRATEDPLLSAILTTGLLCNHAQLNRTGNGWEMTGEPTEGALITLAFKGWCDAPMGARPLHEIPFSSERKRMSVLYSSAEGNISLTKGAPEQIVEICSHVLTSEGQRELAVADIQKIRDDYTNMAQEGLRVIALAHRTNAEKTEEDNLTFLGLVGLIDPPRPDVRDAITGARAAGIRTIMITGDSPITATAIARQVSLPVKEHLTGEELDALDNEELQRALRGEVLFARTKPEHKMRIVSVLQSQDQIVAMTGDGVNDAPALKKADIGVAMGIRGTDVARDASDLVLLDDNFATIVRAIGEGRRQFANIRKFVRYLLSSNAGEVIALVINIAIGGPLIFLATQILWMNLVTDGITAVALGMEKTEPDLMQEKPRGRGAAILGLFGILTIIALGLYTGLSSLWIFLHLIEQGTELARTTAFTAMVVFEKFSVFAFRSLHLPTWRIGWFSNRFLIVDLVLTLGAQLLAVYWPPLQALLQTVPIGTDEWKLIAIFVLPILIVPEVFKTMRSGRR